SVPVCFGVSFFFTVPVTTKFYTLSLHDALPIYIGPYSYLAEFVGAHVVLPTNTFVEREGFYLNMLGFTQQTVRVVRLPVNLWSEDRKSTRLNSNHVKISYAVFCLKKKKYNKRIH